MMIYCTQRGKKSGSSAVYDLLAHAYDLEHGGKLPEIKKSIHGKPYFPYLSDIHFSLSHSATHVLCALSENPVGCDIESPRIISRRVLTYFSTPAELEMFAPLELWVLKESYVKLYGRTIASIRDLRISRNGDDIVISEGQFSGDPCADVSFTTGNKEDHPLSSEDRPPVFKTYAIDACIAAVCSLSDDYHSPLVYI